MKIYCLGLDKNFLVKDFSKRTPDPYAYFGFRGTWISLKAECSDCSSNWYRTVAPLRLYWEPSSTLIGDISYDGLHAGYSMVIKKTVKKIFQSIGCPVKYEKVIVEKPDKKRNVVPFPYLGPELLWVNPTKRIDLDMKASKVRLLEQCDKCNYQKYTFRYKNIVIPAKNWKGEHLFRITTNGVSDATFITEYALEILRHHKISNIRALYAGNIK